jgi:hypothetical protein
MKHLLLASIIHLHLIKTIITRGSPLNFQRFLLRTPNTCSERKWFWTCCLSTFAFDFFVCHEVAVSAKLNWNEEQHHFEHFTIITISSTSIVSIVLTIPSISIFSIILPFQTFHYFNNFEHVNHLYHREHFM